VGDQREPWLGPQVAEEVPARRALIAVRGVQPRQVGALPQVDPQPMCWDKRQLLSSHRNSGGATYGVVPALAHRSLGDTHEVHLEWDAI
jgi:hypothetical protein